MGFEEDTYNTIFKAMQHPIRRRILRIIGDKPSTYTEVQKDLNIDNGLLNYHLDALSSLITKNTEDKYTLSDFGVATTSLIRGVEEPKRVVEAASSPPVMKWLAMILGVALMISGFGLIELNSRYLDLSGRYNTQSLELAQLQYSNMRLEETLDDLNATLISTQKTPLLEASLNQLLTTGSYGNATRGWMWILNTGDIDNVNVPYSVLDIDVRLVSEDDVRSMAMKTNVTRLYSVDELSLTDQTHGVVRFSCYDVSNVGGVPSIYGATRITYLMERSKGDWTIYISTVGFEDYFRAIPLFED